MANSLKKSLPYVCSAPAILLLLLQPLLVHAGVAGRIQFVAGDVRIVGSDGRERAAQKGGEVLELESILTGNGAQAQIKMIDGGLLALRPDTQIKLDAYVFDNRNAEVEKAWLTLIKGGLRSLTGLIGTHNKERYAIRTPNAVIGVRGTDHEPVVILPDTLISQTNPPGTYDKVNVGVTSITTQVGTTLIQRNQIGFASAANAVPTLLKKLPDFYQTSPQVTPQAKSSATKEQTNNDSLAASQVREDGNLNLLGEKLDKDAGNLAPPMLAQQSNMRLLTGIKPDGTQLDTNSQNLIDLDGGISIIDINNLTPISPVAPIVLRPDLVVGFTANSTNLQTYLAQAQNVASSLTQQIDSLRSADAATTAKQSVAVSAMENARQTIAFASDKAQNAYDAANVNGSPLDSKILTPSLNAFAAAHNALTLTRLAIQGDGLNPSVAGLQNLSAAVTQEYARYAINLSNWQRSNSAENRLALQLDDVVLNARTTQLSNGNFDLNNANSMIARAKLDADNAYSAATQAQSLLSKLPSTDPHYASYQTAVQDALRVAKLAQIGVKAAQDALDAAKLGLQKLSNIVSNTQKNIGIEQLTPEAKNISNGNYGVQLTNLTDVNGSLIYAQGVAYQALGPTYSTMYFSETQRPVLVDTTKHAPTGLAWGRWQGGQIITQEQYTDRDTAGKIGLGAIDKNTGQFVIGNINSNITDQGPASLHWITGISAEPKRLAQSLTGTANYTMVGGTRPTDNFGQFGTLNSAQLNANFSTQSVSAIIDMTFGNNQWVFGDNQIALGGSRFEAQYCASCTADNRQNGQNGQTLAILTKNGVAINANSQDASKLSHTASISGSLMGVGLSSAGLQYSVTEPSTTTIVDPLSGLSYQVPSSHIMQGVVGFSGPTQNTKTPYRAVTFDDGSYFVNANLDRTGLEPSATASIDYGSPAARLVDSVRGMDEFIGIARNYTPVASNNRNPKQDNPATIKRGTASNTDLGSAKFGTTTVNWGRWENGVVDVYSRDGSIKLGSINNQGRSMHWINTSASSENLASLPLTGTANYKMVGGTAPTDLHGNVGVVNGAKVDVDFSTLRANTSLGVSFNSPSNTSTWSLEVRNTPFLRTDIGFNSSSNMNGINGETHQVNCSGMSCGNFTSSAISGFFLGQGASGLGFTYDLFSGDRNLQNNVPSNNVPSATVPKANAHGIVILRK